MSTIEEVYYCRQWPCKDHCSRAVGLATMIASGGQGPCNDLCLWKNQRVVLQISQRIHDPLLQWPCFTVFTGLYDALYCVLQYLQHFTAHFTALYSPFYSTVKNTSCISIYRFYRFYRQPSGFEFWAHEVLIRLQHLINTSKNKNMP